MKKINNAIIWPKHGVWSKYENKIIKDCSLVRNREFAEGEKIFSILDCNPPSIIKYRDEDVIFGGYIFSHFGHFLLESLSRLNLLINRMDLKIIFIGLHVDRIKLKNWQYEIFQIIGIDVDRIEVIFEPIEFKSVVYEDAGYRIRDYFSLSHMKYLSCIATNKNKEKIWLSRSNLEDGFRWRNENILEESLIKVGWTIIHPELYPVKKQVEIVSSASIVSGVEGSAFHSVILAKEVHSRFLIFTRPRIFDGKINNNFKLIADKKNINQKIVSAPVMFLGDKMNIDVDLDCVLNFLLNV